MAATLQRADFACAARPDPWAEASGWLPPKGSVDEVDETVEIVQIAGTRELEFPTDFNDLNDLNDFIDRPWRRDSVWERAACGPEFRLQAAVGATLQRADWDDAVMQTLVWRGLKPPRDCRINAELWLYHGRQT